MQTLRCRQAEDYKSGIIDKTRMYEAAGCRDWHDNFKWV
jgi:hypothetical protein